MLTQLQYFLLLSLLVVNLPDTKNHTDRSKSYTINRTTNYENNHSLLEINSSGRSDTTAINQIKIETGSGKFLIDGGSDHKEKTISVFYHKPKKFSKNSPILIVIPGSGRDGDEYRDAWIDASEKHSILILSPKYPEATYDFGQYHMGGLMTDMQMAGNVTYMDNSNEVYLDEKDFSYDVNLNEKEWIFNDFDRLFDLVVKETGSAETSYDMFGHSAGGQILHRFVLFHPKSKADKILASNSGFYTMPNFDSTLPFGLKNTPIRETDLLAAFKNNLILFIGQKDNEHETGGILLRSPSADQQGTHRLARGNYFFSKSKQMAEEFDAIFNWDLQIVPDVGHNFRLMSKAATTYLYEQDINQ